MEQEHNVNAIETTYDGYRFRSRLEAKWAYVFNQLHWDWEYEPIDLGGYIPDFLINFGNENHWYVEIKPAKTVDDFQQGLEKSRRSRGWNENWEEAKWREPLLMLGARLGLNNQFSCCEQGVGFFGLLEDTRFSIDVTDLHFVVCPTCTKYVPVTQIGAWNVPCGCDPPSGMGDLIDYWPHKHWRWVKPANCSALKQVWADAHNATRWTPPR